MRSRSRDPNGGVDSPHNGNVAGHYINGEVGRHSKVKHLNPNRTSLNEMKRRVAAILEFISRTQVEMAAGDSGSTPPSLKGGPEGESSQQAFVKGLMAGLGSLAGESAHGAEEGRDFNELTSAEMMDVLTRRLVRWQQEFGKWGER